MAKFQEAQLMKGNKVFARAEVPAFPDNPRLLQLPDGRLWEWSGDIGFGVTYLTYAEVPKPYPVTPVE